MIEILMALGVIICLVITGVLNRLRGTGLIFSISKLKITGTIIYSVYFGLLFGLLTQNIIIGTLTIGLFLLGESMGFGKWVGALTKDTPLNLEKEYNDKEGKQFPFIHYIANIFIKEKKDFINYCRLALFIRGLLWGICVYLSLINAQGIVNFFIVNINYIANISISFIEIPSYISVFDYALISFIYGIGFPLACYLATLKSFNYKNRFISIVGKWESQEVYYGFIHFICNLYILLKVVYG